MNLKHQITKSSKTICLECRGHTTVNKAGNCNVCNSEEVYTASTALRIPKKTRINAWNGIKELARVGLAYTGHKIIYRISSSRNTALFPRAVRESCNRNSLKHHLRTRVS